MRWMGVLFSILLLIAYGVIFNTVQANSVAHAMEYAFHLPEMITGSVLAILTLLVIVRGIRGVARLMQWLVPGMALLWVITSLVIGLWNSPHCQRFLKLSFAALLAGKRPQQEPSAIPLARHSPAVFSAVCSPTKLAWVRHRMPQRRRLPGPHILPLRGSCR